MFVCVIIVFTMAVVVLLLNVIAIFNVLLFHHVLNIVVVFVMMFLSCVLVCFIMLHGFQVFTFAFIFFGVDVSIMC